MTEHPLDNQLWHCLTGRMAQHSVGSGEVRMFRPARDQAKLAGGIARVTPENLSALAALVTPGSTFILHSAEPIGGTAELESIDCHPLLQMVANRFTPVDHAVPVTELSPADLPAMSRLIDIAKPGPLLPGAFVLGRFVGITDGEELVAIAGDRIQLPGYREVCTVCSHPKVRGRGYARIVSSVVAEAIVARGETPYLMVLPDNAAAVGLYKSLSASKPWRILYFNLFKRIA